MRRPTVAKPPLPDPPMSEVTHNPWPHRLALITVLVSLLPVSMGALTTTLDAGMAFNDWPSSDGHNMLTYPWFRSYGDKFVEHGHRLAGMLIGVVAIGLVFVTWRTEKRQWVRFVALMVLLGVIGQGLLGGSRVRLDTRILAMIHGQFAAWVVSLMALLCCFTSRRWPSPKLPENTDRASGAVPFVCLVPFLIVVQYTLGGLLRHRHTAMQEHLVFSFVVMVFSLLAAVMLWRTQVRWLRGSAMMLMGLVLAQMLLGAGAWITRFGLPATGFVATVRSLPQIWFRTLHTVVGMMLFAGSVVAVARTLRVASLVRQPVIQRQSHTVGSTVLSGGAS